METGTTAKVPANRIGGGAPMLEQRGERTVKDRRIRMTGKQVALNLPFT